MNNTLLNIVNRIIFKKQIYWKFGIENAKLVTKHAVGCDSISEMIFSGDYNFTGLLVPDWGLSETTFLEKLKIKDWSYTDFVVSAILYCIQYELTRGVPSFFILSKDIVYLLFDDNILGQEVFDILKYTNLFCIYKQDTLSGINSFFSDLFNIFEFYPEFSKNSLGNSLGIGRILSLFFVKVPVINKCISDCKEQDTIGPLMLALYVLQANVDLSIVSQFESIQIVNNFNSFKRLLIKKKYLGRIFFLNLFFREKDIKSLYGFNIRHNFQKAGTGAFLVVCLVGGGVTLFSPFSPFSRTQTNPTTHVKMPQFKTNVNSWKQNTSQTDRTSAFSESEPIKRLNRSQVTVYARASSNDKNSKSSVIPTGSILGGSDTDDIEMISQSVEVKNRQFTYEYFIARIDGIYYFCPYGIYGPCENVKYDMENHIIPHAKQIFKQLNVPFVYLGDYDKYEVDHVLKQPFREAFNIPTDKGNVVVVPNTSKLNADRTNKKPNNYEYSLFDMRIKGPWKINKMPFLSNVIQKRLWESLLWTRHTILNKLDNPSIKIALNQIETGYNGAIARELRLVENNFLNKLTAGKISDVNQDSCFAFLQEMLLQARQADLQDMKDYKIEFIHSSKNLISKNFFIRQVVTAAEVQISTSQALYEFMKDFSCKTNYKKRHEQLTRELEYELKQFINSYSTYPDFNKAEARGYLQQLSDSKKQSFMLEELLTVKNNQYINLENMCNKTLQLGNSYKSNGKTLDLGRAAARAFARLVKQPVDTYLEKSRQEPREELAFPQLNELTSREYDKLIEQATSDYERMVLKFTNPHATSKYNENENEDEKEVSDSSKKNKKKVTETSEFPNVPGNQSPPRPRKTSEEDRLNKLRGTYSPNVSLQDNQPTNVPPIQNN